MAGIPIGLSGQKVYGTHDIHIPPTFETAGVAYSATVIVNGRNVHRMGDRSEPHTIPLIPPPPPHPEFIIEGIPTVLVEGHPIARLGSVMTNGGAVLLGSHSVFIGGVPSIENAPTE
jgi:uncharacterized Zn-binding protein involved in type VI secretion